ncbi:hypothetical protein [Prochlorococcus sp. MIT 1223]|uniref:hypothetical protein n=1 Tax=Prochlorococcus sp. MIT 1223 TaxID=3096217 RepID=UPI002A76165D|nr:hypothetical protein [Prochlorococcus sp. MIT 1223]|tara:strand:- start:201 stop:425 length:225 start_codon:yes stop_codon:yes gene_type:complete
MAFKQSIYRLIGLDGRPHKVLDAPYDSMDAALGAAKNWCNGQGLSGSLDDRSIGIEVMTSNGSWRTVCYPNNSI